MRARNRNEFNLKVASERPGIRFLQRGKKIPTSDLPTRRFVVRALQFLRWQGLEKVTGLMEMR